MGIATGGDNRDQVLENVITTLDPNPQKYGGVIIDGHPSLFDERLPRTTSDIDETVIGHLLA